MGKSDYLEAQVLNWTFRRAAFAAAPTTHAALFTANPTDAGGGTEASYGGATPYARQPLSAANFGAASTGSSIINTVAITFPQNQSGGSVTVTGIGVYDAAAAGNLLYWHALSPTVTVNNGDTPVFSIGAFIANED